MDLEETETWNDCAGEGQQQFNRPIGLTSAKTQLSDSNKKLVFGPR
jgi:hypothetical protein